MFRFFDDNRYLSLCESISLVVYLPYRVSKSLTMYVGAHLALCASPPLVVYACTLNDLSVFQCTSENVLLSQHSVDNSLCIFYSLSMFPWESVNKYIIELMIRSLVWTYQYVLVKLISENFFISLKCVVRSSLKCRWLIEVISASSTAT